MAARGEQELNGRKAVCPHCGSDVTKLDYFRPISAEMGSARLSDGGDFVLEKKKYRDTSGDANFSCPKCEQVICTDAHEAERFLRTRKLADEEDDSVE